MASFLSRRRHGEAEDAEAARREAARLDAEESREAEAGGYVDDQYAGFGEEDDELHDIDGVAYVVRNGKPVARFPCSICGSRKFCSFRWH